MMARTMTHVSDQVRIQMHTISPNVTLREAARRMREYETHALLVRDRGAYVGVVSADDIVSKAIASPALAADMEVAHVMRPIEMSCNESEPPEQVGLRMQQSGVRHLLVLDAEGDVLGLISWDDLVTALMDEVSR